MRSLYRKPFKSTGGLLHFAANALGEVYFPGVTEHDIVRIAPDGQLSGRFVTAKQKGLTPVTTAIRSSPRLIETRDCDRVGA